MEREKVRKILVYDDSEEFTDKWTKELKENCKVSDYFEVDPVDSKTFMKNINELLERQSGKDVEDYMHVDIDNTSIFYIDYKLLSNSSRIILTGEEVAYLVRSYSTCKVIIGMNQYSHNEFDLTLEEHPQSHCELNIGEEQISLDGFWDNKKWEFRPWYWPHLPSFVEKIENRIKELKNKLNHGIIDFFDLTDHYESLPLSILSYLGNDPRTITFREFVQKSGNGIKYNDPTPSDMIISHIAAVKIGKWFEKIILPGQNFFVDIPHLAFRYPSLISGDPEKNTNWNNLVKGLPLDEIGFDYKIIEKDRFQFDNWLSKPVWYWEKVMKNNDILEVKEPWNRKKVDYRFCEDSSSFKPDSECIEYKIEYNSPYKLRYINKKKFDVDYKPSVLIL